MYSDYLIKERIRTYKIKLTETKDRYLPRIRIGTMHRVKGLEFDYVFLAGINEGMVPLDKVVEESADNVTRNERLTAERSLLYVAATRAKRAVFVSINVKIRFHEIVNSKWATSDPLLCLAWRIILG
jgi:superfamily I DNA/RNA helicase